MAVHGVPRHIVVFDCNIYLDAASLVGAPFTMDEFDEIAIRVANGKLSGQQADAVAALAVCTSGRFAGDELLEVWSSTHIDETIEYKAAESAIPDPVTGLRGLGWSDADAEALVIDLIGHMIAASGGNCIAGTFPDSNPPLDHEDGMVYGACRWLAGDDPLSRVYCVTNDGGFLKSYLNGDLAEHTIVLTPGRFVSLVRAARAAKASAMMRPKPAF